MNDLVIIGTGGMALEIYGAIKVMKSGQPQYRVKGFVDIEKTGIEVIDGLRVIMSEAELGAWDDPLAVVIGLTDCKKREFISTRLMANPNLSFPSIIHPSAIYAPELVSIDQGCFVAAAAVMSPGVVLEAFALVNILASLAHNTCVGSYSVINPHANVSGAVKLGQRVLIGASAVIHQGLVLADDSVLGMGAVLTRNTVAKASYFGNPARKIMENA